MPRDASPAFGWRLRLYPNTTRGKIIHQFIVIEGRGVQGDRRPSGRSCGGYLVRCSSKHVMKSTIMIDSPRPRSMELVNSEHADANGKTWAEKQRRQNSQTST
jgi:hypothetical protein